LHIIETTADSNQILHSDKKLPNTLCGWSKHSDNKSKMVDGRHFVKNRKMKKSQYRSNGLTYRRDLLHSDAY